MVTDTWLQWLQIPGYYGYISWLLWLQIPGYYGLLQIINLKEEYSENYPIISQLVHILQGTCSLWLLWLLCLHKYLADIKKRNVNVLSSNKELSVNEFQVRFRACFVRSLMSWSIRGGSTSLQVTR